ncbi:glycosyltransferase family 9 protein [Nocardioides sp. BYT-33-1]|uniref:glycosyltransferase family 9 protein n=1 Tax=Nocardioides sp. BYT-33-1 TaxID=3416952 RepID=UPI003F53CB32
MTHRLAVRLDSLGDVLVTGPAIRALRATADRVTLLCGPRGAAAARLLPGVDEVVCWRAPWIDPEPDPVDPDRVRGLRDLVGGLGVDEAVVFTSFHQSSLPTALVLRMAGVPWVGAVSRDYPGSLLDLRLPFAGVVPEPEAQLRLAIAAGGRLPAGDGGRLAVRPDLPAPPPGLPDRPYAVLHPGTSVPARAWPVAGYAEVARQLAVAGIGVVVTGTAEERPLTSYVVAGVPQAVDLAGATDLAGLAAVLRDAAVVVVGNTGPAHLAAAVGTPVVSLFAPTVPATSWAPYGVRREVLGDEDAPCAGSRATRCPVPGHPCLASVTAREVLDAIRRLAGPAIDLSPDPAPGKGMPHEDLARIRAREPARRAGR